MADEVHEGPGSSPPGAGDGRSQGKQTGRSTNEALSRKELSRQQSRAISGKEAARTVGTGRKPATKRGSGNRQRNATNRAVPAASPRGKPGNAKTGQPAPKSRPKSSPQSASRANARQNGRRVAVTGRRSPATLLTWGTVALVIVIVIVLVIVKVLGGSARSAADFPLPSSVANDIATVPASVYDTVGIHSSVDPVTPPTVISRQSPLTYTGGGRTLPGVFYYGAEYCPYCAAERWSLATALARFGKFRSLQATESSSTDVFPDTQTLSFHTATFSSPSVAFKGVERYNDKYQPLEKPTPAEVALVSKYDTGKYISSLSSTTSSGSIPFVDIGNAVLVAGASYSPAVLTGLTRGQIASNLHNPNNPVTQAIIATANYLTAGICSTTGGQPASVCTSKGVTAAAKAMKLKV